jgi:hypothetical protein
MRFQHIAQGKIGPFSLFRGLSWAASILSRQNPEGATEGIDGMYGAIVVG